MTTARQILDAKGYDIWSVNPADSVLDSLKMMADKGIGALLVMDGEKLVGIVTERDYARKVILEGKSSADTTVQAIMSDKVLCVSPDRTVDQCMALMTDKRARHLPVVEHKKVIGMLSIGDLVKAVISDQQILIDQLQHYISG